MLAQRTLGGRTLDLRTVLIAVIMLGATSWSRAGFFNFDPDGTNNPNGTGSLPAVTITGFDHSVGNSLAASGRSAIANFLAGGPAAGNQFDLYYQATLGGYGGSSPPPPSGINLNYQLTFSMRARETITSVTLVPGGGYSFTFAATTPPGGALDPNYFVRMYYNGAATTALGNGNLSGLTFQDGRVILDATPVIRLSSIGNFTAAGNGSGGVLIDTFDKSGVNDYPNVTTAVGNGSSVLNFAVNAVDPTFFVSVPSSLELDLDTSLVLPFNTVDPSQQFRNKDSSAGLGVTTPGALITPNIGGINGASPAAGGATDVQFEADANSTLSGNGGIPEPAAAATLSFVVLGWLSSRRRLPQRNRIASIPQTQ